VKRSFRNASFFVLEAASLHWGLVKEISNVTNRNVLLGIAMQSLANASSSSSSEEAIRSALSLSHLLQFSEILEFLFESGVFDELMCVCRAVVKSNTAVQLACAKLMKVLLHSIKVKFFFFFCFFVFF
jgi:hypothetical protein